MPRRVTTRTASPGSPGRYKPVEDGEVGVEQDRIALPVLLPSRLPVPMGPAVEPLSHGGELYLGVRPNRPLDRTPFPGRMRESTRKPRSTP